MLNLSKLLFDGKKNLLFKRLLQFRVNAKFSTNVPIQASTSLVGSHTREQWDKFKKENIRKMYKLSSETDVKGIVEKYKRFRTQLKLNEEIVFLHSVAEVVVKKDIKFNIIQHPAIDSLLEKIKAKLRNSEEDYPLIGSLAYALNILKLYKDPEIWLISSDYVIDGRLNGSFEELIELFKGCANIQQIIEGPHAENLFSVLEDRYISEYKSSTILLADLVEVAKCYSNAQRSNFEFLDILYQNFSNHILNYLKDPNMQNFRDLTQLAYRFAGWEFIESDSYNYFQDMIEALILKEEGQDIANSNLDPESLALITYSLGIAVKNEKIIIRQSILKYLIDYLTTSEFNFQLTHLEYFYRFLPNFDLDQDKSSIYLILKNKIYKADHSLTNLNSIRDYITTRVVQEFHDNIFEFPLEVFKHLDQICAKKLWEYSPQDIYEFFDFIEETEIRPNFPELWFHLPEYIVAKISSFNFEQMCYLYYVYVKHGALKETGKFKENLEVLKDYILLHYAATARGKLSINSNFYKVLEVVDINKFYQKGEY